VLDRGLEGFEQSAPFRKMGQHSSPTGELFLTDVVVGRDRLLGETEKESGGGGRASAKDNFVSERAGTAAMALGVIEECLALSIAYAKDRVLWGKPIGEFQLIQLKLATWRWPVSTWRTSSSVTSRCRPPGAASRWPRPPP